MELLERVITPPEVVLAPKEPHSTKKDHYGSIAGHWLTPEQTIGTVVSLPCSQPPQGDLQQRREICHGCFQAEGSLELLRKGSQQHSLQRQSEGSYRGHLCEIRDANLKTLKSLKECSQTDVRHYNVDQMEYGDPQGKPTHLMIR